MTAAGERGEAKRKNPYVGPRAFRSGEDLPGRDFEIRELTDLLIAERITLLHAPSGAGKTSLNEAARRGGRCRSCPRARYGSRPPPDPD
jgi:hypothetical protein